MTTEDEWQRKLTKEQYDVLRLKKTETPYTGKLLHNDKNGNYFCGACGNLLFNSQTKFDDGSGWPSFYLPVDNDAVKLTEDQSFGMRRIAVSCAKCGSHLGHVFHDAPDQPSGMRFCVNSVALDFKEAKGAKPKGT